MYVYTHIYIYVCVYISLSLYLSLFTSLSLYIYIYILACSALLLAPEPGLLGLRAPLLDNLLRDYTKHKDPDRKALYVARHNK